MFETLKAACQSLREKDNDFALMLNTYIMHHSSVNGLVSTGAVDELWKLALDGARPYVGKDLDMGVRAVYSSRQKTAGTRMF